MNWKEIEKKYPSAWRKLVQFVYGEDTKRDGVAWGTDFTERDLYDFFDEQGIYIGLDYHYAIGITKWFEYSITFGERHYMKKGLRTGIRKEAEEQAFLKAFGILEEQ